MKLVKTKVRENKTEIIKVYISEIEHYIMFAYLFCMLGVFPLYYKEQYSKIGTVKFEFFWNTSFYFVGISLIIFLVKFILHRIGRNASCQSIIKNKTTKNSGIKSHKISDSLEMKGQKVKKTLLKFLNHFSCIWARWTTYRFFLSFFFYAIAYFPET